MKRAIALASLAVVGAMIGLAVTPVQPSIEPGVNDVVVIWFPAIETSDEKAVGLGEPTDLRSNPICLIGIISHIDDKSLTLASAKWQAADGSVWTKGHSKVPRGTILTILRLGSAPNNSGDPLGL